MNAPIATRITSTATTMAPMMVCCLRSFSICSARAFMAAASAALRSARLARFCASLLFWAIHIPFDISSFVAHHSSVGVLSLNEVFRKSLRCHTTCDCLMFF